MTRPLRVGLFGGSFDPVHHAHLALAQLALDTLTLDTLIWVPAGDPWQKRGRVEASAEQRAAMVALAIADEPRFELSRSEIERQGPSYTLDTVTALQAEPRWAGAQWFLLLGQDQVERLPTWHRWTELLPQVTLAVTARQGVPITWPEALVAHPHKAVELRLPPFALSSTTIRDRLHHGLGVTDMVPAPVARYIDQYRLYRGNAES
jgi:nicotinate-nucleotide adenylyltransferase